MSQRRIVVDPRFCGPPGCGNGGYVCGRVAEGRAGPYEVKLLAPAPVGRPLRLTVEGGRAELADGGAPVAAGGPCALELDVPAPVGPEAAAEAASRYAGFARHPFPGCFVCGPQRAAGDGLRVFAGPVAGREGVVAAPWTPDAGLADADGRVRTEFVWAALDCPGYFAVEPRSGPAVLGRLCAEVLARPRAGERTVVMGWRLGGEGRKHGAGTALFGETGALLARARAVWVAIGAESGFL